MNNLLKILEIAAHHKLIVQSNSLINKKINQKVVANETFNQWCARVLGLNYKDVRVLVPLSVAPNRRIKSLLGAVACQIPLDNNQIEFNEIISAKDVIALSEIILYEPASFACDFCVDADDYAYYLDEYGPHLAAVMMRLTHLNEYCEWLSVRIAYINALNLADEAISYLFDTTNDIMGDVYLFDKNNTTETVRRDFNEYLSEVRDCVRDNLREGYSDFLGCMDEFEVFANEFMVSSVAMNILGDARKKAGGILRILIDRVEEAA